MHWRRWRSRLFNLTAASSFAAFALVSALMARSYFVQDEFGRIFWDATSHRYGTYAFAWDQGRVFFAYYVSHIPQGESYSKYFSQAPRGIYLRLLPSHGSAEFRFFHFESTVGGGVAVHQWNRTFRGGFAIWPLILLTALPPVGWLFFKWKAQRRDRMRQNVCKTCGYDLQASPARCPECGTTVRVRTAETAEKTTMS